MRSTMPNVVTFLKQQLTVSLGLPWQERLPDTEMEAVLNQHKAKPKRDRLF
jgi:hypothetical protein